MNLAIGAAELALWEWDIVHDEIWSTEKGRELFGIAKMERISFDHLLNLIYAEDREPVRLAVDKSLAGGGDYEGEYRVVLPDGDIRWFATRGQIEYNKHRHPLRMYGVSIDITRRKQAELDVQKQRNELAHLSRLTMLGELSGTLAHELNQPLAAILSNAQAALRFLAQDAPALNDVRDILKDIVGDDKRASEVIHRLRLLLRKDEVQHQPLEVNEVVQDVLKLVRSDLASRNIAVNIDLSSELPAVIGDRVLLQQVLLNLILNGCDAVAHAELVEYRRLHIHTLWNGEAVQVSVGDQGRGIALDDMERIFEPFFTTKPQGMGLGLAICRNIITAHNGQLWATNNADCGASFYFTLPAVSGRMCMNGLAPTVFIVDDDPSVLKALGRLMRSAGLNAATFASPQEFLDNHDQNAPGCLVLDVAMPHINGLELQQALAASGSELTGHFPHRPRRHSDERAGDKTGRSRFSHQTRG